MKIKGKSGLKPDLSALRDVIPPFLSRKHPEFETFTGYSPRSFANMDSNGRTAGISRISFGNSVAYERDSLIRWLENNSTVLAKEVNDEKAE